MLVVSDSRRCLFHIFRSFGSDRSLNSNTRRTWLYVLIDYAIPNSLLLHSLLPILSLTKNGSISIPLCAADGGIDGSCTNTPHALTRTPFMPGGCIPTSPHTVAAEIRIADGRFRLQTSSTLSIEPKLYRVDAGQTKRSLIQVNVS